MICIKLSVTNSIVGGESTVGDGKRVDVDCR